MTFICPNKTNGTHTHELVLEAKVCMGLVQPPRPNEVHVRLSSSRQRWYIGLLGGDGESFLEKSWDEASAEIDRLKALKYGDKVKQPAPATPSPAQPAPRPAQKPVDPRLAMLDGLLDLVPDGYYAVRAEETSPMTFLRISHPKTYSGKPTGGRCLKIQTQHSDVLETAAARFKVDAPTGPYRWYVHKNSIVDALMLLVVDHQNAGIRYASELGQCSRCNKSLTDERSRHYGIGPECEKVWQFRINFVDERWNGRSYEELHAARLV